MSTIGGNHNVDNTELGKKIFTPILISTFIHKSIENATKNLAFSFNIKSGECYCSISSIEVIEMW